MGVAKNEAVDSSVMSLSLGSCASSSSSSGLWVKRLKTSTSLKRSFTGAFFSYEYKGHQSEEPFLKKRRPPTLLVVQNAAYDCWIRRWQPLPLPQVVIEATYDAKHDDQLPVASVGAMALMARSMGYSQSLRIIRKSTSLVAWA